MTTSGRKAPIPLYPIQVASKPSKRDHGRRQLDERPTGANSNQNNTNDYIRLLQNWQGANNDTEGNKVEMWVRDLLDDGTRLRLRVGRMLFVGEQHRPWDRDAARLGDDVVEVLVVAAPPERVVDDLDAAGRRLLQVRPVKRHVVADAVKDNVVIGGNVLAEGADLARFGNDLAP